MAGLGIAHHRHTNAFEKPVVAEFAEGDGLVVHIPGRFWNAGQERLGQHVYEREQRLLPNPQIANSSCRPVQARSDPLFRRVDATFTAG